MFQISPASPACALVKDSGLVTLEFPHLLRLIEPAGSNDTIYHEHFSYLSLLTSSRALATAGLRVVDVESSARRRFAPRLRPAPGERGRAHRGREGGSRRGGVRRAAHDGGPRGLRRAVLRIKSDLLDFLLAAAGQGRSVAGDGAPGRGNTLLNHCGIRSDLLAVHGGPQPGEAGKVPTGHHIRSTHRSGWPKPDPTTSSSCPGTSGMRSRRNLITSDRGVGL